MNARFGTPGSKALLVETSALVAVVLLEPGWQGLANEMADATCSTCAFNVFEGSLAIAKQKSLSVNDAHAILGELIQEFEIEVVPLTPEMLPHAVAARDRYGRGRKGLNMGDCLSYGAAKQLNLKLLYKGDDFAATDVNG